jgi:beta-RFAP synthase
MMIFVRTASRLHFGLLSLAAEGERWPDRQGTAVLAARRFGGVGLMVSRPGVELAAEPAAAWSAEGPLAERALVLARQAAATLTAERPGADGPPLRLRVVQAAAEHAGLGTGTQLGMAAARVVAAAWGVEAGVAEWARWSGRGLRSGLGVHGFAHGGLLAEAGKRSGEGLAPLVARVAFPEEWRVVLALPAAQGLHGAAEREAFAHLAEGPGGLACTEALCRLALLGLLPAAAEHDLAAFGAALYDFNRRSGEMFAAVQGGLYASAAVAALVEFVRSQGVAGVGQSSWGPAVFAVLADEDQAEHLARQLGEAFRLAPGQVVVTGACNHGASLEVGGTPGQRTSSW